VSIRLVVRDEAEADIEEAFNGYETQEPGLGAEFIRSVDAVLASVGKAAGGVSGNLPQCARALLRRFPYAVFYIEQNGIIEVLACMHFRRHPRRWRSRLR
jgi:plasmid stabilization system protein ParE